MPPLAAGLLVFATSAAVLVIEILAARLLAPYVGVTLQTYTAIIGVVLAGISLGAWVGGRLADRGDPRRLLGPTVMLGGALALTTVPVVRYVGTGLPPGDPATTIVLALFGFFPAAAVLSAVAPMVVKVQLGTLADAGSVVGRLSAIGTAGALVGTFVTGYVLVAAFPTPPVLLGVGAALLLVGLALAVTVRVQPGQSLAAIAVLGLLGGGLTTTVPSPCEVETAYHCAAVIELPPCQGRTLYLDTLRHSCVHLDDPSRLDFSYAQILSDVLAAMAPEGAPLDALHIGGGGFSLPRYLAAERPGSTSLVLELDPTLVEIAERDLGLETGPDLRVEVGDARTALYAQPDGAYDLVIGDAFGGLAVPWHLTTVEVVQEVERTLRPGGVYAVNLIDNPPLAFARAETATLGSVFAHVAVIAPQARLDGRQGGNFVLVASDEPLPLEAIAARNAARGDDDAIASDTQLDAFLDGAAVLTDDYAPVDQLLTPR